MAKNKTLELSIKIAGKIDKSLLSALTGTKNQISGFSKGLSKIGTAGLAAMTTLGVGAVKVITDCTKEAANFENYMSDVVKYVDGLADATGKVSDQISKETGKSYAENYAAMKDAILDLSTQIPYTQQELAALAGAAGEAGKDIGEIFQVDKNGNVTGFLKNVAMAGTAMDVTADQAGSWAAKWETAFMKVDAAGNRVNFSHNDIMTLFDQINYLAANGAASAADIAEVVNASGSLGGIAGMDPAAIAAMANAMLSMGSESSVAATSINRMLVNMNKGASATKAQKEAWKSLGMTAEGVASAMQMDSTGTMIAVLEAIGNLDADKQAAALNTLFGQWAIKDAAKLAGNINAYTESLKMVSDPALYSGSMEREFIIKATTPEALEAMRKSTLQALQIEMGDAFLPAKKEFDMAMIDFLNNVRDNMPALQRLAETLGTLASKGVKKLGEKMEEWLPKIQDGVDWMLENGDKVISTIKGIAGVFTAMKLAPVAEGIGKFVWNLFSNKKSTDNGLTTVAKMVVNAAVVYMNGKSVKDAADTADTVTDVLIPGNKPTGTGDKGKAAKAGGLGAWLAGLGTKISGGLASVGTALGSGATTTAGAAAAGAGGIAGGILGGVGLIASIIDFFQGANATDAKTAKNEYAAGGSKLGMVGAGAGAGALIGSVVPGLGTAIGALIGAGVGGIGALFGGDALGQWISDSTDEGGWMNNVWKAVCGFFTETVPTFFTQTIPEAAGKVGTAISTFFTQTVPDFFGGLWDGIVVFFTQTVPYTIGYVCGVAYAFFTEDVPKFFSDLLDSICTFFTSTLPTWASNVWNNNIVPFFTEDIPTFFGNLWSNICNFFTSTLPTWASNTWNNNIVPFFTKDIPTFFGNLWSNISTFFTTTIPTWASDVWNNNIVPFFTESIPGFFASIWSSVTTFFTEALPTIASDIWSTISGWFSGIGDWISQAWSNVTSFFSSGFNAGSSGSGYKPHAWGGLMTSPHIGLVAEAGPEMIIPLSRNKNARGVSLWMQAGRILGVGARHLVSVAGFGGFKAYADGGLAGKLPTLAALRAIAPRPAVELKDPGDGTGGGQGSFTFAPNIVIQGNADRAVIEEALAEAKAQFETWYNQMQRRQARTAY